MSDRWAIIPARGGSKGLPGKNIRSLGGKPLIAHSIEAALAARRVSRVIVSTDDPGIAEVARAAGAEVPFLRPARLGSDHAEIRDVLYDTVDRLAESAEAPDGMVLLYPTHPFRTSASIDRALELLDRHVQVSSAVPVDVTPAECQVIHEGRSLRLGTGLEPMRFYFPTGSFTAMVYTPPGCRPHESQAKWRDYMRSRSAEGCRLLGALSVLHDEGADIDINTVEDLERAEAFLLGEKAERPSYISSLPFCVMGLKEVVPSLKLEKRACPLPMGLQPGVRYVILLGGYRDGNILQGTHSFHELKLESGGPSCRPLFGSEKRIEVRARDQGLEIHAEPPPGTDKAWICVGREPDGDFCDLAKPFSLPPFWRFDFETGIRLNLLTGRPIRGRQDCPVIMKVPTTVQEHAA